MYIQYLKLRSGLTQSREQLDAWVCRDGWALQWWIWSSEWFWRILLQTAGRWWELSQEELKEWWLQIMQLSSHIANLTLDLSTYTYLIIHSTHAKLLTPTLMSFLDFHQKQREVSQPVSKEEINLWVGVCTERVPSFSRLCMPPSWFQDLVCISCCVHIFIQFLSLSLVKILFKKGFPWINSQW